MIGFGSWEHFYNRDMSIVWFIQWNIVWEESKDENTSKVFVCWDCYLFHIWSLWFQVGNSRHHPHKCLRSSKVNHRNNLFNKINVVYLIKNLQKISHNYWIIGPYIRAFTWTCLWVTFPYSHITIRIAVAVRRCFGSDCPCVNSGSSTACDGAFSKLPVIPSTIN